MALYRRGTHALRRLAFDPHRKLEAHRFLGLLGFGFFRGVGMRGPVTRPLCRKSSIALAGMR